MDPEKQADGLAWTVTKFGGRWSTVGVWNLPGKSIRDGVFVIVAPLWPAVAALAAAPTLRRHVRRKELRRCRETSNRYARHPDVVARLAARLDAVRRGGRSRP